MQHGIVVAAFYRFTRFPDFQSFRQPLKKRMLAHDVRGTVLLAREGVNGTIAGSRAGIDAVLALLREDPRFAGLETKESLAGENPFYRTKVKLKKEIVTMGVEDIDPGQLTGTYVDARDWNSLISDPQVTVIDTRNDYEHRIGTFKGALNPETASFREFPRFVQENLDPSRHKKIAMFCTGGIRCEKSTAFLKRQGFENVYHLHGGILKYLESVPETESLWQGECFVFDNRVTVDHKLDQGGYDQCHACRMPISDADKQSVHYQKGVSCPHCHSRHSEEQMNRYAEREHQIELAKKRGEAHIGQPMEDLIASRRREKLRFKNRQRQQQGTSANELPAVPPVEKDTTNR